MHPPWSVDSFSNSRLGYTGGIGRRNNIFCPRGNNEVETGQEDESKSAFGKHDRGLYPA